MTISAPAARSTSICERCPIRRASRHAIYRARSTFCRDTPVLRTPGTESFLRKCIPVSVGGDCADWLTSLSWRGFYTVDPNVSLTCSLQCSAYAAVVGGTPEQRRRFLQPFLATKGAPLPHSLDEPAAAPTSDLHRQEKGAHHRARFGNSWVISGGSIGYLRPPDGTDRCRPCSPSSAAPMPTSNPRVASRSSLCLVRQRPILEHAFDMLDTVPISRRASAWTLFRFRPEICWDKRGRTPTGCGELCG